MTREPDRCARPSIGFYAEEQRWESQGAPNGLHFARTTRAGIGWVAALLMAVMSEPSGDGESV